MHEQIPPQSRVLAAMGQVDITPPVGIYHRMWGAALHDQSEGVHRPLMAILMILRRGMVTPIDRWSRSAWIIASWMLST